MLKKVITILVVFLTIAGISIKIISANKKSKNISQKVKTKFKQPFIETEITPQQDLTISTETEPSPSTTPKKSTKPVKVESTPAPESTTPINTPNPSPQLRPLTTPTPQGDTQPPVFENITGPEDGSTIDFNSFCFPLKIKDNISTGITVRYSFDNSGVSDWNQNYAPCYFNVSNGFHFFVVQAKDAAGNTSDTISRNFTVQVN